ncbi:MAG: diguanylate cyclase [Sulfuricurvum sp.]|uniref:sensor domain-containing diguanylate cyclase n=1 Tax=Sulfuricurvum sp. TaxID=2025608 RepID=UPI00261C82E6|nr:sensor domain-containing diguanylate cyclase [Sulfuricurvum sp.]MDD2830328.1 diguanylate cyclase [Sulfuricurvum sp.]MDD4950801.1 diguanylate cyclase [Sulfuricurvum sp.]
MNGHANLLKVKLLWLFMLFALIPMVLIALYSYYDIKKQLTISQLSHLEAIAKLKSLQIEHFYDESKNNIQTINSLPYAKEILYKNSNSKSFHHNEIINLYEQELNSFVLNHNINDVYVIGLDGKIVASSTQSKESIFSSFHKLAFEQGKTKIFFSNIYKNSTSVSSNNQQNRYSLTASSPIVDVDNKLVGVVVVEFSVDNLFLLLQDYSGLGSSGETLLGKRNNEKIIFLNPLRHDPNAGMRRSVQISGKIGIPVVMGATGHNGSGMSVDYRGVSVLAAWRHIPIANWGMVAKIDTDEALKPLVSIRDSIFFTALFILILGIVVSSKMTNNLIRPIDHLEADAHVDSLTGLPNRKLLMGLLEQVLKKAKLEGSMAAVMFLDLDGFKSVNDTHGHEMGDLLLKNVAQRLTNCIRQSDTVARLGGDEFIILLSGTQDIGNVVKIADTIIQKLNEEFFINNTSINIGASIGISIFPDNTINPDEMLQMADKAMYDAKQHGKNHYKFVNDLQKESLNFTI